jgi:DNA (cytosine-5)-methyltransferase 1
MARLHGFPDWFRFHPTKWHGARQIGNAVPPPLARAVAESILSATLGIRPIQPRRILKLDSEDLLSLDMKGASEFWGVENPIGKRDKKSGARKRKQVDIERERLSMG